MKRDGIELTGSFTAQIDANLAVGGVTETITVSGTSPIVDVQSIRRQTTISNEVLTIDSDGALVGGDGAA